MTGHASYTRRQRFAHLEFGSLFDTVDEECNIRHGVTHTTAGTSKALVYSVSH